MSEFLPQYVAKMEVHLRLCIYNYTQNAWLHVESIF